MSITILVLTIFVDLAWTLLAIRLIRLSRGEWFRFLKPLELIQSHPPTVNAIVPARNEEAHVERTVQALQAQDYPALTITIVDDQSTDATLAILERLVESADDPTRLRCLQGTERPPGWVGKTWAVHQGVLGANSEWLWFVDADMGLHPKALTTAVEAATLANADFVSFLPGVRCQTFWQGAIASAFLQLLGQLYPLDRVNDPSLTEAIAAGGFVLVRRSSYDRAGGHEAVRSAIIEDIQLAKNVKGSGGKLLVRLAPDLAWTHMYGSFRQIWQGLRKNAYAGMDYQPHKFVTGALIALLLAWMPMAAWVVGAFGLNRPWLMIGVGAWGILAQVVATIPILIFLKLPILPFALTVPLGITSYVGIATSSAWHYHRGRIFWKDRTILSEVVAISTPGKTDQGKLGGIRAKSGTKSD